MGFRQIHDPACLDPFAIVAFWQHPPPLVNRRYRRLASANNSSYLLSENALDLVRTRLAGTTRAGANARFSRSDGLSAPAHRGTDYTCRDALLSACEVRTKHLVAMVRRHAAI